MASKYEYRCAVCAGTFRHSGRGRHRLMCPPCSKRWGKTSRVRTTEQHVCGRCGSLWARVPTKGQRPKWCKDCRTITCQFCGRAATVTSVTATCCSSVCAKRLQAGWSRSREVQLWIPPRKARKTAPKVRHEKLRVYVAGWCAWCSESFVAVHQRGARFCSERCSKASYKAKRDRRFRISPRTRAAIYERDGWICQLCIDPVDPTLNPSDPWAATLDHIVCQSWGEPDHSPENLRLAHRWCNSVRGNETYYTEEVLKAG